MCFLVQDELAIQKRFEAEAEAIRLSRAQPLAAHEQFNYDEDGDEIRALSSGMEDRVVGMMGEDGGAGSGGWADESRVSGSGVDEEFREYLPMVVLAEGRTAHPAGLDWLFDEDDGAAPTAPEAVSRREGGGGGEQSWCEFLLLLRSCRLLPYSQSNAEI